MKTTLILAMLFVATIGHAQITINQSNFAQAGDMFITANDTNCVATPGSAGANQTYNLATMNNHSQDTTWFLNAAGQPGAANFPTANLVQKNSDGLGDFVYVYMQVTPTFADIIGLYEGGTASVLNYRVMTFPTTYNTAYTGSNVYEFAYPFPVPPYDSMKLKYTTDYSSLIDGWGTVTTPSGSRACLRQRMITTSTDSTFVHDSLSNTWAWDMNPPTPVIDTTYTWLGNMERATLANLSPISAMSPTASGGYLILGPTAVSDLDRETDIQFYPNPFNTEATLETATSLKNATLTIYNTLGQPLKEMSGLSRNRVHVTRDGLASGLYYLHLKENGKLLGVRKLMIAD